VIPVIGFHPGNLLRTLGLLQVQADFPSASMILSDGNSELVFSQFVLYPAPLFTDSSGNPIQYWYRTEVKLKADLLDNDMSVPRVSHIQSALIEFVLASLYTRSRQLSKADAREQKAIQHIQAAVNLEKNQSESFQQVIPTIYDRGDYLGAGSWVSSSNPFGG
jgi:hypothetical protein